MALSLGAGPALADKVGVAAAVNPDAFSSLSSTPNKQLNIGKSIFYNERINTTNSGLVQVLLIDGSTFTVGPNSDLVIDKFVYDPRKKTGELVATFSKGTMRFIGGKLSKNNGGVTVKTPSGALAIRGGMFQGSTTHSVYSFLYGHSLTVRGRNGQTQTIFQPGWSFDFSGGSGNIRQTTRADINAILTSLTNGSTSGIGSTSGEEQTSPKPVVVETLSLQDLISDATATQINDSLSQEEHVDEENPDNGGTPPPPPQYAMVTMRVLATPSSYTAFGGSQNGGYTTYEPYNILGGDPTTTGDDFTWTFAIVKGRLVGTVTGLTDTHLDCSSPSNCQMVTTVSPPAKLNFPFVKFPGGCAAATGACVVTDAKLTQNGQTPQNYAGIAVLKKDFWAYYVANGHFDESGLVLQDGNNPEPILMFGGKTYNFAPASGKLYVFQMTGDILEPGAAPFASSNSMPSGEGNGYISPLLLLEKDGGSGDTSRGVWLQSSLFIGGSGSDQESFINVALGEWDPASGLTGARRGGSSLLTDTQADGPESGPQSYTFSGDIASLKGPNGSTFLGTTDHPNVVLGFDSTGTHNIGRDQPLNDNDTTIENQSGSAYHIGIGTDTLAGTQQDNVEGFKGFAAGIGQSPGGDAHILGNFSPDEVTLTLDKAANTMSASVHVGDGLLQNPKYNLEFGGEGHSAYIDSNIFAAFEDPGKSKIEETVLVPHTETYWWFGERKRTVYSPETQPYVPDVQSYLVSADAIHANEVLFAGQTVPDPANPDGPEIQKRAFCQDCTFIKWGAWGARTDYTKGEDQNAQTVTNNTHLGWWIAGDVLSLQDMQAVTATSATYRGDAIGTVATGGKQYVVTGSMNMNWDFKHRAGTLNINKFDGKNFRGPMFSSKAAPQQFNGVIGGSDTIGAANGAFVGRNGQLAPKGVIGNFGVSRHGYQATGIYGGTQR